MNEKLNELMTGVLDTWNRYWNGSGYWLLLLAAVAVLLLFGRKKSVRELGIYQLLAAFAFFFPVSAWVIQKCVGELVYWRTLWLFPVVPAIALAMSLLVKKCRSSLGKGALAALFLALIVVSGTSVWQAGNFVKVGNRQQVPDTVAEISRIVTENRTSKDSLVAADDYLASYLRVYDPSVKMPYGRQARGTSSRPAKALYLEIMNPEPSYRRIAKRAKVIDCELFVAQVPEEKLGSVRKRLKKYGFTLVGKADGYAVFQDKNKK